MYRDSSFSTRVSVFHTLLSAIMSRVSPFRFRALVPRYVRRESNSRAWEKRRRRTLKERSREPENGQQEYQHTHKYTKSPRQNEIPAIMLNRRFTQPAYLLLYSSRSWAEPVQMIRLFPCRLYLSRRRAGSNRVGGGTESLPQPVRIPTTFSAMAHPLALLCLRFPFLKRPCSV